VTVRDERTLRAAALAGPLGADVVLLCSLEAVCYATGYAGAPELGPSPHAGGPNVALVAPDGATVLVVPDLEAGDAAGSRADALRTYETFAARPHAAPPPELLAEAVTAALEEVAGRRATIAAELSGLPVPLAAALRERLDARLVDAGAALARARATKTAAEIAQLRECAELTAVGQRTALEAARPGMTELELFGAIRSSIEAVAGSPFVLGVDLISGVERTAEAMGAPSLRRLREGDPVLCDLGPRVGGYWGDSCNTFVLGEPGERFLALHAAAVWALERATEVIRPGVAAGAVDDAVREPITRAGFANPLHIGHGIGTANFEFPRVVPGEPALLEAGMVLMIEPGAYAPGTGGVRLEWMFLVTEGGNEIMSPYQHQLVVPL
jgi:Xaa-Pro dipeptidase